MKNVLSAAILLLVPLFTFSQTDTIPKSAVLHGNNISAIVNSNGLLFHDLENGEGGFTHDDYPGIPLIKSVGFWAGAVDPGGNLKVSVMDSRENGRRDFIPGYLDINDFPGKDFNYVAKVSGIEIQSHLGDYHSNGIIDFPISSIFRWSGAGNPHFEAYTGMTLPDFTVLNSAPFYDENSDGIYDPMDGDFPSNGINNSCYQYDIFPNELLWTTFHDVKFDAIPSNHKFLNITIQPTIFSYNCSQNDVSKNTVYVNYRIIHTADESIDSLFFGLNIDFDLGCPLDDYLGVSPENESVYVYNASEIDEDCDNFSGLNATAPILLCDFRRATLRSVIPQDNNAPFPGMQYPNSDIEHYRYLSGSWRDGSPIEFGGDGYQEGTFPTDFIFPDNPNDLTGWSDAITTAIPNDKNFLGSSGNLSLQPGSITNVMYVFSVVQNTPIDSLYSTSYYDQYYDYWARSCDAGIEPCNQFTNTEEYPIVQNSTFTLYPNPTSNLLNLDFKTLKRPNNLKIFDLYGKELWTQEEAKYTQTIAIDWLPAGVYFLEANFSKNSAREKFIVVKD
ncbi:MAG: hypothetical protein ACI9LN_001534 [Saprospiraceae bacterium]|jgi:hypothetical protein